jgi:hypothetical protein
MARARSQSDKSRAKERRSFFVQSPAAASGAKNVWSIESTLPAKPKARANKTFCCSFSKPRLGPAHAGVIKFNQSVVAGCSQKRQMIG